MIPLCKPVFNKEMADAALNALNNEKFVMGESVLKFEQEFAKYCGTDYAVSTSSGTEALRLALVGLGLQGKEIITSPSSFIATSNSVVQAQGKPVFSDADFETCNLDPKGVEKKITSKTGAILPIHLYGLPADMEEIGRIAAKKSLAVIEDACQAHGASLHGKRAGSLGHAGCFSFYPTKNLTVGGDGGMVTTNDKKLAELVAKLRNCGRISQYEHDEIGYTSRLNTVNAAIGRVQLRHLDAFNEKRREIAEKYRQGLTGIPEISLPNSFKGAGHVYHLFACKTAQRDKLAEALEKKGVQTGKNYPIPIHLQPVYKRLFGFKGGEFPVSERISREVLCLPMFPEMKGEEVKTVVEAVSGFFA